jgi:hypothetical protein
MSDIPRNATRPGPHEDEFDGHVEAGDRLQVPGQGRTMASEDFGSGIPRERSPLGERAPGGGVCEGVGNAPPPGPHAQEAHTLWSAQHRSMHYERSGKTEGLGHGKNTEGEHHIVAFNTWLPCDAFCALIRS